MDRAEHARLAALSPLDGRYAQKVDALRDHFGEFALIRERVRVEIAWLLALADEPKIAEVPPFSSQARGALDEIAATFSPDDAARVKAIERRTNHDVNAVEYWLKERVADVPELSRVSEFVHFACTSEDINNLAYSIALLGARTSVLLPALEAIAADLRALAHAHAAVPMLSRTHGQAATPTTLGKEFANFYARLSREIAAFGKVPVKGKMNGAVGNYNAHAIAYPDVDWERLAARTITALGLELNPYTTQIEP
ncbi:MAG TPA: lyase family protein, partial [Casimicrobiaceae bacterium]